MLDYDFDLKYSKASENYNNVPNCFTKVIFLKQKARSTEGKNIRKLNASHSISLLTVYTSKDTSHYSSHFPINAGQILALAFRIS